MTDGRVSREAITAGEAVRGNRRWWDGDADAYQAEHGAFLGDADFVWCPEGLRETDVHLLGDVAGRRVLEVGAGAAPCARWLASAGAWPVALDLSAGQLRHAQRLAASTGVTVPLIQADAAALPFVTDSAAVMREVARVLRPGGRWVFSVTHPMRWVFLDDGGPAGLTVVQSYFDRAPYVERDAAGTVAYAEQHRTLGDRLAEVTAAGFALTRLVEPEWPAGETRTWGQWTPLRGALFPGTAIYVCVLPG
jgi:SAM-dependent methyltransferase